MGETQDRLECMGAVVVVSTKNLVELKTAQHSSQMPEIIKTIKLLPVFKNIYPIRKIYRKTT